jgi:hypothetical protein
MIFYQPVTPYFDSIKQPNCSECGTATRLFGIEAERPGRELQTFVCLRCNQIETAFATARRPLAVGADPRSKKVPLTGMLCRQYAEECIAMAECASGESVASLHRMAEAWLQLAEQLLTKEWPATGSDQNAPSSHKVQ